MVSTSALSNLNSLAMVVFLRRADLPSSQARARQVAASARAAAPPGPADSLVRGRHLVAARLQVAGPAALRGQLLPGRPSAPPLGAVSTAAGRRGHVPWSFGCGMSAQSDSTSSFRRCGCQTWPGPGGLPA